MASLIFIIMFIGVGMGVRKLFRAAKSNPEAAIWCVGAARKLLKR